MNRGFVYIVESPSDQDLLASRTEGKVLSEALDLAGIPRFYNLAVSKAAFLDAIGNRLVESWRSRPKLIPILHLSLHGNSEGVELTDHAFMPWDELRGHLRYLTEAMAGTLLICMSSCFGAAGCRMAMHEDPDHPFWALVGHVDSPLWADAAVGYVTLYHLFFKGVQIPACVEAMKIASGDPRFTYYQGAAIKKDWADFTKSRQYRDHLVAAIRQRTATQGLAAK